MINTILSGCMYLCLIYGHAVKAAPTSIPKWKTPCGTSDSTLTISPMPISLKNASDALKEKAAHFTRVVSDMKAKYVRKFQKIYQYVDKEQAVMINFLRIK